MVQITFGLRTLGLSVGENTLEAQRKAAAAAASADEATAAAATVAAALAEFVETDKVGRPEVPANGTSGTANTRIFAQAVPRAGRVKKVHLYTSLGSGASSSLKIKKVTRDAGAGDLVSGDAVTLTDAATLTIDGIGTTGGVVNFDVDFAVEAGDRLGFYFAEYGAVDYLTAASDSGGFWSDSGKVGDNATMTVNLLTAGFQWQIGFEIEVQVVTTETERKAAFAYEVATATVGRKPRPVPAITADIDWIVCLSADFITPGQEVGTDDRLQEWLDRTGNGNTPATLASILDQPCRPIYDEDAFGDGVPGVQFNGGAGAASGEPRVMQLQHMIKLTQPFTYIAIIQIPDLNTARMTLADGYSSASAADRCALGLATGGKPYIGIAPATTLTSPGAISADEPHLMIGTFNGASSSLSVDSEVVATGQVFGGLDGLNLGEERGAVARWNGAVGLFGIVNGTLSDTQIAAIEAYAAARYGVGIS